jgi:hypothetical protein
VTYRINGRTEVLTGLFALPRVQLDPGDLARTEAGPVTLLMVALPEGSARLVVRSEGGRPALSLEVLRA